MLLRLAAFVSLSLIFASPALAQDAKPASRPEVEVVFCLDTTGSMGGLILAAKQKIWAISNQIASGRPTPLLKVGLVAYRDRGDEYVTKVFDLTDDLDAIHGHLQGLKAAGGGDFPERESGAARSGRQDFLEQKRQDFEAHLPRRRRSAAHGLCE